MDRGAWQAIADGVAESDMTEPLSLSLVVWRLRLLFSLQGARVQPPVWELKSLHAARHNQKEKKNYTK